jgi:amino acid transporter
MLFFLPFPGWQAMVGFLVSCFVIAYAVGPIACMALRKTMPEQPRPFKLPFAYGISLLAFYICNLIIYWTSWTTVWRMLMTIVLGYVVLFGYRKITKDKSTLDMKKAYWILPYFVGLALISYLGNFAGIKLIPFGWDFVVLAVFSWVIFHFAVRAASHSKPQ